MSEAAKVKNLWGDLPVEEFRTPHVMLREQASILTEATNGLLVGTVVKEKFENTPLKDTSSPSYAIKRVLATPEILKQLQPKEIEYVFTSRLEIIVPSINNYSISIVQIDYPLKMYPLKILSTVTDDYRYQKCETEEEFNQKLEEILSSSDVKKIIAGLLTEIRADAEFKRNQE